MVKLHLKLNRKSALIWSLSLGGMLFAFMAFFPSMANDSMKALVDSKFEGLPDSILSLVGLSQIPDFSNINVFYAYMMQYLNIALAIFSLTLGLNSFLKEEKEGTIEFLYAQPQSRMEMMFAKLKANFIILFSIVTILVGVSILSLVVFKPNDLSVIQVLSDNVGIFLSLYIMSFLFVMIGSALSMVLSSALSINALTMSLVFGPYILGVLSAMMSNLSLLRNFSILHILMPNDILKGDVSVTAIGMWCAISIVTYVLALRYFKTRDIRV